MFLFVAWVCMCYMHMCYMHMCAHERVGACESCRCTYILAWGGRKCTLAVCLSHSLYCMDRLSNHHLARLANQQAPRSTCLNPSPEVTDVCLLTWLLNGCWRSRLRWAWKHKQKTLNWVSLWILIFKHL